jgi:hypothetical protein
MDRRSILCEHEPIILYSYDSIVRAYGTKRLREQAVRAGNGLPCQDIHHIFGAISIDGRQISGNTFSTSPIVHRFVLPLQRAQNRL